jgi:DNA-binding response OmpR family regulator
MDMMSKVVMVIDDSPTICEIIEKCLRPEGYEVVCFSDGLFALKWLQSQEARIPDLILVDLCLPHFDGYSVIWHLRTQMALKQTVFVIISRRDGVIDRLKGRIVGANAYLTKPFKTTELLSLVQTSLGVPIPG